MTVALGGGLVQTCPHLASFFLLCWEGPVRIWGQLGWWRGRRLRCGLPFDSPWHLTKGANPSLNYSIYKRDSTNGFSWSTNSPQCCQFARTPQLPSTTLLIAFFQLVWLTTKKKNFTSSCFGTHNVAFILIATKVQRRLSHVSKYLHCSQQHLPVTADHKGRKTQSSPSEFPTNSITQPKITICVFMWEFLYCLSQEIYVFLNPKSWETSIVKTGIIIIILLQEIINK